MSENFIEPASPPFSSFVTFAPLGYKRTGSSGSKCKWARMTRPFTNKFLYRLFVIHQILLDDHIVEYIHRLA